MSYSKSEPVTQNANHDRTFTAVNGVQRCANRPFFVMNDGFENRERARQLIDFSGLEYGMTDIDGITEYHDRIWIWCEIKMQGKALPVGQKLAMERFVSLCKAGGKKCLAIVADHDIIDPAQDVQMRDCAVREVFTTETNGWTKPKRATTVGEAQRLYIQHWGVNLGG